MAAREPVRVTAPRVFSTTRVLAGSLFACHGAQKLLLAAAGGLPAGTLSGIVWTAGLIELVGGALIARRWGWTPKQC